MKRKGKKKIDCEICKERYGLDTHHIVPKFAGGTEEDTNKVVVCALCHRKIHLGLIVINGWENIGWKLRINYTVVDAKDVIPLTHHQHKKEKD